MFFLQNSLESDVLLKSSILLLFYSSFNISSLAWFYRGVFLLFPVSPEDTNDRWQCFFVLELSNNSLEPHPNKREWLKSPNPNLTSTARAATQITAVKYSCFSLNIFVLLKNPHSPTFYLMIESLEVLVTTLWFSVKDGFSCECNCFYFHCIPCCGLVTVVKLWHILTDCVYSESIGTDALICKVYS